MPLVIAKAAGEWQRCHATAAAQSKERCEDDRIETVRNMSLRASRRGLVPPFIAMDVLRAANERAATGADVLHLEVGQPGTQAPAAVREAARRALSEAPIGYTDALGIAALRRAIAEHYRAQYGVAVDPGEVVVTTGSSAAFQLAFLAAFEAGDRVALAAPGYPAYRNILAALGLEPVLIEVGENSHYQPNPELLAAAGPLDGLVIASPANPTGTMIAVDELARLVAWCRERDIRLVSDEIYHGITYEGPAATARAYGRETIVINSFSKYYSMTGWRLGWMLAPPDLARSVECLAQNFYISPPSLSQLAALPVFGCRAELDGHVARYRANRDLLIRTFGAAGLGRFAPAEGAFYLYVDVSQVTGDSVGFCRRLLAETGVALTPGLDFDPIHGGGWVRLSFAGTSEDVAKAACRLAEWLPRRA
jgi:aspartate/methionine/tyrosine aminotransferase